jgi:putative acetyltransferase
MPARVIVRTMRRGDREAALNLWTEAWQSAYPAIDFAARRPWMDARFDELARAGARLYAATVGGRVAGFVTIDPESGYLDQLVVARAQQRRGIAGMLLARARQVCPQRIDLDVNQDNCPAVAFYRKHGFTVTGTGRAPLSGAPTYRMTWRG